MSRAALARSEPQAWEAVLDSEGGQHMPGTLTAQAETEARHSSRNAPLRVAYLARYTAGGSAVSLRTLLLSLDRDRYNPAVVFHTIRDPAYTAELAATGIDVTGLVAPWPAFRPVLAGPNLTARWSAQGWRVRALHGYQTVRALEGALRLDRRWQTALARQLRRLRPALVHCNNGLRAHRLDILLCSALRLPVVCHMHNFERLTALERLAGRAVKYFVYVSRAVAADFERQGIPASKGVIIPNALLDSALVPSQPLPRAALGCTPEDFVVANVGRLVRWKGQDVFLRAVAVAAAHLPQLRALIVGDADDNDLSRAFAQELRRLAVELGIAERVVFTGHRPDVQRVMAAADVVVHSAATPEPFGLVLLEALAVERPLVAAGAGGVLDVLEHEVTGLVVPPNDAGAIARCLERLSADPALRARLGAAGRRHVMARFNAREHVEKMGALYQRCLGPDSREKRRGI